MVWYLKAKCNSRSPFSLSAVDFFNQINMLYGTITEFCSETSCSVMSAGPRYCTYACILYRVVPMDDVNRPS